jgi:hypothetical protein
MELLKPFGIELKSLSQIGLPLTARKCLLRQSGALTQQAVMTDGYAGVFADILRQPLSLIESAFPQS